MAEEHFLAEGQRRYDKMLHRRALIREFIEENYGVTREKQELMAWLKDNYDITVGYSTLQRDFLSMNVQEIEVVMGGRKVRFWSIPGYVGEFSPERLNDRIEQEVIEAEAYRAMMRTTVDVFTDGKRVVINTVFEGARSLALWLKNLMWPEIWYFSKEDGSSIIIECRTPEQAKFLVRRLWGTEDE